MLVQTQFRAMGSQMLALLDGDQPAAGAALGHVPAWFEDWEQRLSRFRDDSELSQLNRRPAEWVPVGDVLWAVLDAALAAAERTAGLVTPTLLPALEAAGYTRSFELLALRDGVSPALATLPVPALAVDEPPLERDLARHAVRLARGTRLDFGGVAKGWAADHAAARLSTTGPALVDAGGDIAISGPLADGTPWSVGVADPANPDMDLEVLRVARGGVATSGRDYRRWQQNGVWQHHILDPRAGQPAVTDVLSATVVAPSAEQAEAAAKAAFILGSRDGLAWVERQPALAALLVLESGRVVRSRGLAAFVDV